MLNIAIKDLEVTVDIKDLMNALSSEKSFLIDISGNILLNNDDKSIVIMFKSDERDKISLITDTNTIILNLFKTGYKPSIKDNKCILKPIGAWLKIVELNKENHLYFDHQSDGIELFEDKQIEEFGWFSSALEINHRKIASFIEENTQGTFVFFDNDIIFNGFVISKDINECRAQVKDFIIKSINKEILDLDDAEVIESLEFFKIKA